VAILGSEAAVGGTGIAAVAATHADEIEEEGAVIVEEASSVLEGGAGGQWSTIGETPGGTVAN